MKNAELRTFVAVMVIMAFLSITTNGLSLWMQEFTRKPGFIFGDIVIDAIFLVWGSMLLGSTHDSA